MVASTTTSLEDKKRRRLEYMNALYEATDGSQMVFVDMWELGTELGWERPSTDVTVEYLRAEGLLSTSHLAERSLLLTWECSRWRRHCPTRRVGRSGTEHPPCVQHHPGANHGGVPDSAGHGREFSERGV